MGIGEARGGTRGATRRVGSSFAFVLAAVALAACSRTKSKDADAGGGATAASPRSASIAPSPVAASFDCAKATTPIENVICDARDLRELDSVLASVYRTKLASQSTQEQAQTRAAQRTWLSQRDECAARVRFEDAGCVRDAYERRITELGGDAPIESIYRARCARDDSRCYDLGRFEFARSRWLEAERAFDVGCQADHDGDGGWACYQQALALEHLGRHARAMDLADKACDTRKLNEACAFVMRGRGTRSANPWVGLYRNDTGTVFVTELPQGKLALRSDTHWEHGDACSWEATGVVEGENLKLDTNADASCALVIRRVGRTLVVADPEYRCKEAFCGHRAFADGTFTLEPSTPP